MSGAVVVLRAVLALVVCAIGVGFGGCAEEAAVSKEAGACDQAPATQGGGPIVAVLVEDGVGELDVDAGSALDTLVAATTESEARVLVGNFGAPRSGQRLTVDTRLEQEGDNDLMRDRTLSCRTRIVRSAYERIAAKQAGGRLDLISALRNLSASLPEGSDDVVDVVVLGSVLNTDGADLRQPDAREDPAKSVNQLARAGLNFRCQGWRVHVVGGGLAPRGAVAVAVDSQLREWWRRYFDHCGGALVFYAPQLTEFPAGTEEIAAADRSLIPIQIERKGDEVEATVSGDVIFALNSARLEGGSSSVLRKLLPALASSMGTIEVAGYTDSSGTDAINGPLSRRRALAVARWIEAEAGVPAQRIEARGYGAANPVASNATELGRAKNRRVVILIR